MALLEVRNLHKQFGGLAAVCDVSFDVAAHTIKAVIGPNGAGKTTLFNLVAGNLSPDSGRIRYNGQSLERRPAHLIAATGISRTFQNVKLFPGMTVLENVMVGCHVESRGGFWAGLLHLPFTWGEERRIRSRCEKLLDESGISDLADRDVSELAFGQQRRVELARALAAGPQLLLLDEPAAGLNMAETAELARTIRAIKDQGTTILLVEHDMSLVMEISDEIAVLSFGRKIAEGTPRDIQRNPEVVRIYLGEEDALRTQP